MATEAKRSLAERVAAMLATNPDVDELDDMELAVDAVTDLMLWAETRGIPADRVLSVAQLHFEAERAAEPRYSFELTQNELDMLLSGLDERLEYLDSKYARQDGVYDAGTVAAYEELRCRLANGDSDDSAGRD